MFYLLSIKLKRKINKSYEIYKKEFKNFVFNFTYIKEILIVLQLSSGLTFVN